MVLTEAAPLGLKDPEELHSVNWWLRLDLISAGFQESENGSHKAS